MTKLCLLNIFESAVTDSESRHTLKIESSLRILNLVQSNLIGLAPETNDLELLVPILIWEFPKIGDPNIVP